MKIIVCSHSKIYFNQSKFQQEFKPLRKSKSKIFVQSISLPHMYPYVPEHTADDVAGSLPIRFVLSGIGMALFTTSVITSVTIKMSNYPEV